MSIKSRITILVAMLLLGFALALGISRWLEYRSEKQRLAERRDNQARMLEHWLSVTNKALPLFAADVTQSGEVADRLAKGDLTGVSKLLEAAMTRAGMSGVWLVRADGSVRLQLGQPATLPLAPTEFVSLTSETPQPRFFVEDGGVVNELAMRQIRIADGHPGTWVVVARTWTPEYLQQLGGLMDSTVTLQSVHETAESTAHDGRIVITCPLADWAGRTICMLRVEHGVSLASQPAPQQTWIFVVFGLLLLAGVVLAIERWVVEPLARIGESLKTGDIALVTPLAGNQSELGRVARLVQASFEQRAQLEREVEQRKRAQTALEKSEEELRRTMDERVRLGRDLHDGVIQTLYAAGMGLAGVRPLLDPEQTEAAARLEQTRAALNETIHDVRNFIVGLEPEALKSQTFTHAVGGLLEIVQGIRPAQTEVKIDESLAERLTLSQRVHALQIAREAVSNALRHSNATHIAITLRLAGHFAEFEIADDGQGFDVAAAGPGRGLANFAQRARELGGELVVDSAPGRGTTVKLTFSFHLS